MRSSDIAWNLLGLGAPLAVAALTVPSLIGRIGMERFGLLALAFGLVGFGGIFDLGVGRAATQAIARLRGSKQFAQIPPLLRTATSLSLRTGIVGTILLAMLILAGAPAHIKFSAGLRTDVTITAYLVALAIPLQSVSAVFRGVNEAFENFREINLVRIGLGIANFLGPFCVALFTSHLSALVSTLVLSRLAALFLFRRFAKACLARRLPTTTQDASLEVSPAVRRQLLSFGGWFTVSSLISPILTQADRFFIGALVSASAVAAYTIPYEVVTRSLIVVGAVSSVAFPSLSKMVHSEPERAQAILRTWLLRTVTVMFAVMLLCATLLPVALPWWIGPKLPDNSVLIGQILCVGVFANSLGCMYFALLHAHGRADITAKLHLIELPLFILALYFLITNLGVIGAALAWVGRMLLDTFLLWAAHRTKCAVGNSLNAVGDSWGGGPGSLQDLGKLVDHVVSG